MVGCGPAAENEHDEESTVESESMEGVHPMEEVSCDVKVAIMEFVDGKSAIRMGMVLRGWHAVLMSSCPRCERFWREATIRELRAPGLRGTQAAVGECWRERYARLHRRLDRAAWLGATSRHGMRDRVAAPQMFVGVKGRRLFNYGGWTRVGPQTDLHCCDLNAFAAFRDAARAGSTPPPLRFERCEEQGRPVARGGVQTLTPLWLSCGGKEGPSRRHIAATLDLPSADDFELVVAFGGAGGGYHNEHSDWRVAGVSEDQKLIRWTSIGVRRRRGDSGILTPRCAHTATYVPGRLSGGEEGHIFVVGGHTDNCARSLATVDCLDVARWTWSSDVASGGFVGRHGHSTTLVERCGRGYLVVVGGGTGNILHGFGDGIRELDECWVLDIAQRRWLDGTPLDLGSEFGLGAPCGRHHTASAALHGTTLLLGGGSRPTNRLGLLDCAACVDLALARDKNAGEELRDANLLVDLTAHLADDSPQPAGRKMHAAACLLPWLPVFVCFGGWQVGPHFADLWLADLANGLLEPSATLAAPAPPTSIPLLDGPDDNNSDDNSSGVYSDDDNDDDDELVTVNVLTTNGEHQLQLPRSIFLRSIHDGMLGLASGEGDS